MDNCHGTIAHSPQKSPYSIELLIRMRIVIVLIFIDLCDLESFKCNNQSKDLILVVHFHPLENMTYFSTIWRTLDICFAKSYSMQVHSSQRPEGSACLPWTQTILLAKSFYLKIFWYLYSSQDGNPTLK